MSCRISSIQVAAMFDWFLMLLMILAPVPTPKEDPFGKGFLGIRVNQGQMVIASVEPGSAAERVGLMPGDTFIGVSGAAVQNYDQVTTLIRSCRPGAILDFEIRRGDKTLKIAARLTARPASADNPQILP